MWVEERGSRGGRERMLQFRMMGWNKVFVRPSDVLVLLTPYSEGLNSILVLTYCILLHLLYSLMQFYLHFILIARSSLVVKTLCYKPQGHGFDNR
jgi:hypothetical protein